jgi:hypothetical protein
MFQIKKLKSFININTLSVFALTLFLGLIFNSIFGRHIISYSITETFTKSEAEEMVNKRVRADFSNGAVMGTVVSYDKDSDKEIYVSIVFDSPILDTPTTGKIYKLNYGKEVYQQGIEEITEDK